MAAQYQQNATTDLAAYRGTVASGLGTPQFLDTRGSQVTLQHMAVGLNGQQIITWTQNNGIKNTTFAASSPSATATFAVTDLDRLFVSNARWQRLLVTNSGEALYYDLWPKQRIRWTAAAGWGTVQSMPASLPFSTVTGSDDFTFNRNGDLLAWSVDFAKYGRSTTYDASRNVVVLAYPTSSAPGPGYVLGFPASTGYGLMVLSVNGVGFTDLFNRFDVLPTVAAPAGDGRAVDNLWGVFLK